MTRVPDILCIGAVLWDVVGRAPAEMGVGTDTAGRISRLPGGVALNIAMTLRQFGLTPALLSAVGNDAEGHELMKAARAMGLITDHVYRDEALPTDIYMAIEGLNGLIAAVADAHSLEAAGDRILRPLEDGRLGSRDAPFAGPVALDGNLTVTLLSEIIESPLFAHADLRIAPASPGKADRLLPFVSSSRATLYLNLEEAGLLLRRAVEDAAAAAAALCARGAARVLVTDGGRMVAECAGGQVRTATPPKVSVMRVTGAGDTFMAAHIAAEVAGLGADDALESALDTAARYVSGNP